MKRAFILIELMICIAIFAIVAIIAAIAIPNMLDKSIQPGKQALWHGKRVLVVAWDANTEPGTLIIRTETGDQHVNRDELKPIVEIEKE